MDGGRLHPHFVKMVNGVSKIVGAWMSNYGNISFELFDSIDNTVNKLNLLLYSIERLLCVRKRAKLITTERCNSVSLFEIFQSENVLN